MIALVEQAARAQAALVVFPELALTTFFPRWAIDDDSVLDGFFEASMPSRHTQPLFAAARRLQVGLCFGYAELARQAGRLRRFNSSALVGPDGGLIGHYRKVHLPGDREPQPGFEHQHLEKRYFETGDLGFPVWRGFDGIVGMLICNDRRWPEAWRVLTRTPPGQWPSPRAASKKVKPCLQTRSSSHHRVRSWRTPRRKVTSWLWPSAIWTEPIRTRPRSSISRRIASRSPTAESLNSRVRFRHL
jgi:predicted amidohydrolase